MSYHVTSLWCATWRESLIQLWAMRKDGAEVKFGALGVFFVVVVVFSVQVLPE